MQAYHSEVVTKRGRSLQLHKVLQDYREYQKQKSILRNRINNIQANKNRNFTKAKNLKLKNNKLCQINLKVKSQKQKIRQSIQKQNIQKILKNRQKKQRVQEQYQKIGYSQIKLKQFKHSLTTRIKSESRFNQKIIYRNKVSELKNKQNINRSIRIQEQLSKSHIQEKLKKKIEQVNSESFSKLACLTEIQQKTRQQVQAMKNLQKSLLAQYSTSLSQLQNSRLKSSLRY